MAPPKIQILRTSTPNQQPAVLAPGELAIEMASEPPRLWVGVPAVIDAAGMKMLLPSGGVIVSETPPAGPAQGNLWYESDTGILWMWYNDGSSAQWVQVNGVSSGGGSVTVGETPPAAPASGDLWYESDTGIFAIYFDDGTSAQWVQVNGIAAGGGGGTVDAYTKAETDAQHAQHQTDFVNVTGDTMTGPLAFAIGTATGRIDADSGNAFALASDGQLNIRAGVLSNLYFLTNDVARAGCDAYGHWNVNGANPGTGTTFNVTGSASAGSSLHAIQGNAQAVDCAGLAGFSIGAGTYGLCGLHSTSLAAYYSFYGNNGAYLAGGTWATSDARLKTVTGDLDPTNALATVNALAVREFTASSPAAAEMVRAGDSGPLFGWIANEVQTLIPTAVRDVGIPAFDLTTRAVLAGQAVPTKGTPEADALASENLTIKAINDRYMVATLWAAVQKLSAEVEALKAGA